MQPKPSKLPQQQERDAMADRLRSLLHGDLPEAEQRHILTAAAWELEVLADTMAALDAENARLLDENALLRRHLAEITQQKKGLSRCG